jgi:hypothetical protein
MTFLQHNWKSDSFKVCPMTSDTESVVLPSVKVLDCSSKDESFLKRVIICDETRVYGCNVETKCSLHNGLEKIHQD